MSDEETREKPEVFLFDLTDMTGTSAKSNRQVVILTVEMNRASLIAAIVSLFPAALVTLIAVPIVGVWSIIVFAVVFLAVVALGAIFAERGDIVEYTRSAGLVVGILCLFALTVGYGVSRALRLTRAQGIATAYEVGIQNTTLAMTLALSVMGSTEVAIPAAVYSVIMNIFGFGFGFLLGRRPAPGVAPAV